MSESRYDNTNTTTEVVPVRKRSVAVKGGVKHRLPDINLASSKEGHVGPNTPVAPEALAEEIKELAGYPVPVKRRR